MMRFPIKYKILSIILIVLASTLLFTTAHFFWGLSGSREEISAQNLKIAIDISKDLDELIMKSRAILRTLAKHPSVVARDNVVATQFHPEKSGEMGLRMYANFLQIAATAGVV